MRADRYKIEHQVPQFKTARNRRSSRAFLELAVLPNCKSGSSWANRFHKDNLWEYFKKAPSHSNTSERRRKTPAYTGLFRQLRQGKSEREEFSLHIQVENVHYARRRVCVYFVCGEGVRREYFSIRVTIV